MQHQEWSRGMIGFKPASVFVVSQTEGEPLPELNPAAAGEGEELVPALLDAAGDLDFDVRVVDPEAWDHSEAKGVYTRRNPMSMLPLVNVLDHSIEADLATSLIHK